MILKQLIDYLENWAPLSLQESYDNSGLNIGNSEMEISNVLVTLDVTLDVVNEAINKKCNVIVAHHPLIFKGLKNLNGNTYVEKVAIEAIKNDIAIYAMHTNLDNVKNGVNYKIAEKLGLRNVEILRPNDSSLMKLTVFVPKESAGTLIDALHAAGAGNIGNYSKCSFKVDGQGSFKPNSNANPVIGTQNQIEFVEESRIEVIFEAYRKKAILSAMQLAHPYEEVAHYLHTLQNSNQDNGAGAIGNLENTMDEKEFLAYLKEKLALKMIRFTNFSNKKIKKVAVCGGVGSFLLKDAQKCKADAFVTADYKYHEFFDAENQLMIADIGHFESEQFTKELIVEKISNKFTNFATYLSEVNTNPINYYY